MFSRTRHLWRNLVHRRRVEGDLDDELRGIFETLVEEHRAQGMSPAEARRAATLALGRVESIKEQVRDVRAGALWEGWLRDARHGVRLLRRSPAFAAFAVASLALGIGATGAIFSLFDSIVLRQLPVPGAEQLVVASFGGSGGRYNYSMPYPHFEKIRARNTTLAGIFALYPFGRVTVAHHGQPEIGQGVYVTGDYYPTLNLRPAAGRLLAPDDDRPGNAVAVLNHGYWQRRFGGSTNVLGEVITLNQVPFTVIGIEPQGFAGTEVGRPYDVSVPMRAKELLEQGPPLWDAAFATWIYMMGRLKPDVTSAAAEQELKTIFAQVSLDAARTATEQKLARENQLRLEDGSTGNASDLRKTYQRWLAMLMAVLAGVLLLATLNVATLLLSRSDARQHEIATRLAIGAGRWRIVRQLLTESIVLAACAGVVGLGLAAGASSLLLRLATPAAEQVTVDVTPGARLVLFTFGVSVATALLFGLIPAIRVTSAKRLLQGRQVGGGRQRRVLDRVLVAAQVGLSLVLLVAAGLFVRTLDRLWTQDTGYQRNSVLMFSVDAHLAGKRDAAVPATYQNVLDELQRIPGADRVTASAVRPVSDTYYFIDSFTEIGNRVLSNDQRIRTAYNIVAPAYFSTLGIRLLAGRDFTDRDSAAAPTVAIISERMARHFDGSPIGQRLGGREVVGVVSDIRYANVKDLPREVVYFPMFQARPKDLWYSPTFEIRFSGPLSSILQSSRDAVARVDPGLTLFRIKTLEAQTRDSFARERLLALITSYFGGFAALLAGIGLYGLLSYGVTQRTPELGLRMALGAPASNVRWLVVRDSAWTVLGGVAAGLLAARAVVSGLRSQLFGVEPNDPAVMIAGTVLLMLLALIAAYVPARRASRIDPLTALRHE